MLRRPSRGQTRSPPRRWRRPTAPTAQTAAAWCQAYQLLCLTGGPRGWRQRTIASCGPRAHAERLEVRRDRMPAAGCGNRGTPSIDTRGGSASGPVSRRRAGIRPRAKLGTWLPSAKRGAARAWAVRVARARWCGAASERSGGHSLELKMIAEGVEDQRALERLRELAPAVLLEGDGRAALAAVMH